MVLLFLCFHFMYSVDMTTHLCVAKKPMYLMGDFNTTMFMYSRLSCKAISLSDTNLPKTPFLRNLTPMLDEGLLYIKLKF